MFPVATGSFQLLGCQEMRREQQQWAALQKYRDGQHGCNLSAVTGTLSNIGSMYVLSHGPRNI